MLLPSLRKLLQIKPYSDLRSAKIIHVVCIKFKTNWYKNSTMQFLTFQTKEHFWIETNRFCVFFNYFSWVQVGWEIIPNETRFVKWSIKQTVHYFPTLNKFLWSVISQNDLFCNNIRVLVIVFDYFMMF
jgi:hypothetical protein